MTLHWTDPALADRESIFDYIASDSLDAAVEMEGRIAAEGHRLIDFPELGRMGAVGGTRELRVGRSPYLLVYELNEEGMISVLRVLHGAQQWPRVL